MTPEKFISVSRVEKTYRTKKGAEVRALAPSSFEVARGEFITCVGPSGCGKSTLLKILAGLVERSGGDVLIDGRPVNAPRAEVGVMFQSPVLLPWRTVLENVMLPVEINKLDKHEYLNRARQLLELVGLSAFADKYPFELSGGMQQRNAIVRALVTDPQVLLMDEPFGALDAMTRDAMNLELQRIWLETRKTVFFITHSIAEAVFLGDRVMVMGTNPGRVIRMVTIEQPRPRPIDWMASPEFGQKVLEIRRTFSGHDTDEFSDY